MLVLFVVAPAVTLVALARGQRRSTAPDRPMPATGVGPQADVRQSRTSLRAGTDGPAPGRREHGSVVERRTP